MFRLLVIVFVIELHARSDIFINRIFLKLARFKNKNLNINPRELVHLSKYVVKIIENWNVSKVYFLMYVKRRET